MCPGRASTTHRAGTLAASDPAYVANRLDRHCPSGLTVKRAGEDDYRSSATCGIDQPVGTQQVYRAPTPKHGGNGDDEPVEGRKPGRFLNRPGSLSAGRRRTFPADHRSSGPASARAGAHDAWPGRDLAHLAGHSEPHAFVHLLGGREEVPTPADGLDRLLDAHVHRGVSSGVLWADPSQASAGMSIEVGIPPVELVRFGCWSGPSQRADVPGVVGSPEHGEVGALVAAVVAGYRYVL